jgi:phosphopantetheinyl transferase
MCNRHQLSSSSRFKLNERKTELGKRQFIASRALIQHIYMNDFNADIYSAVQIIEGVTPKLEGSPELYISISHSQQYVSVAISQNRIGLDIESPRRERDYQEIANKTFNANESEWIVSSGSNEQLKSRFFQIWTARESLYKLGYLKNLLDQKFDALQEIKKESFSYFFHKDEEFFLSAVTETPTRLPIKFDLVIIS